MRRRKSYTAEEKVRILRRHLIGQVPVSDLCDEMGLQPTVFYWWQKEFFEHGAAAFERQSNGKERESQAVRLLVRLGIAVIFLKCSNRPRE